MAVQLVVFLAVIVLLVVAAVAPVLLGVGLLSVPYALQQGGWAGLGVLGILGVTTNYTGKILIRCQRRGSLPAIGDHQTRCDVNDSGGTGAVRLF